MLYLSGKVEVVELSIKQEKPKREDFKSIKVKESTYEEIKGMGVGISKAMELLVSAKKDAVTKKMGDLTEISSELVDIMLASGVFDIKFRGSGLESIELQDDGIIIRGFITVGISDKDAREEVYRVLSDGLERKA